MKTQGELRLLLVAVIMMITGLAATLAILQFSARSLASAHEVVAENASPSVTALDAAQAQLRRLHVLVTERRLGAPGDPVARGAAIAAARGGLGRAIDEYGAFTTDPGEISLQRAIRQSKEALDSVVDRASSPGSARVDELEQRRELDTAVDRLGSDLARASEFNAQFATSAASGVARVSSTWLPAAAVVSLLTFCAATATLALTYRAIGRADALAARSFAAIERRAEELQLFSGRVAHDMLSPLMTVSLALDIAGGRLDDPADATARAAIARASHTLQRVRRFVSDLLTFSNAGARPTPGARTDLEEAVLEIAEEFTPVARDSGVALRVESVPHGRAVACSPGVLSSVLSNLVENAIRYIGEGNVRRVEIRAEDRQEDIRVEVVDTGPGVCAEQRDKIFEPYARGRDASAPGSGLGLATVRRLVESHGGKVGVQMATERGSVFWFTLPVAG